METRIGFAGPAPVAGSAGERMAWGMAESLVSAGKCICYENGGPLEALMERIAARMDASEQFEAMDEAGLKALPLTLSISAMEGWPRLAVKSAAGPFYSFVGMDGKPDGRDYAETMARLYGTDERRREIREDALKGMRTPDAASVLTRRSYPRIPAPLPDVLCGTDGSGAPRIENAAVWSVICRIAAMCTVPAGREIYIPIKGMAGPEGLMAERMAGELAEGLRKAGHRVSFPEITVDAIESNAEVRSFGPDGRREAYYTPGSAGDLPLSQEAGIEPPSGIEQEDIVLPSFDFQRLSDRDLAVTEALASAASGFRRRDAEEAVDSFRQNLLPVIRGLSLSRENADAILGRFHAFADAIRDEDIGRQTDFIAWLGGDDEMDLEDAREAMGILHPDRNAFRDFLNGIVPFDPEARGYSPEIIPRKDLDDPPVAYVMRAVPSVLKERAAALAVRPEDVLALPGIPASRLAELEDALGFPVFEASAAGQPRMRDGRPSRLLLLSPDGPEKAAAELPAAMAGLAEAGWAFRGVDDGGAASPLLEPVVYIGRAGMTDADAAARMASAAPHGAVVIDLGQMKAGRPDEGLRAACVAAGLNYSTGEGLALAAGCFKAGEAVLPLKCSAWLNRILELQKKGSRVILTDYRGDVSYKGRPCGTGYVILRLLQDMGAETQVMLPGSRGTYSMRTLPVPASLCTKGKLDLGKAYRLASGETVWKPMDKAPWREGSLMPSAEARNGGAVRISESGSSEKAKDFVRIWNMKADGMSLESLFHASRRFAGGAPAKGTAAMIPEAARRQAERDIARWGAPVKYSTPWGDFKGSQGAECMAFLLLRAASGDRKAMSAALNCPLFSEPVVPSKARPPMAEALAMIGGMGRGGIDLRRASESPQAFIGCLEGREAFREETEPGGMPTGAFVPATSFRSRRGTAFDSGAGLLVIPVGTDGSMAPEDRRLLEESHRGALDALGKALGNGLAYGALVEAPAGNGRMIAFMPVRDGNGLNASVAGLKLGLDAAGALAARTGIASVGISPLNASGPCDLSEAKTLARQSFACSGCSVTICARAFIPGAAEKEPARQALPHAEPAKQPEKQGMAPASHAVPGSCAAAAGIATLRQAQGKGNEAPHPVMAWISAKPGPDEGSPIPFCMKLAPSYALLRARGDGTISGAEFRERYRDGLSRLDPLEVVRELRSLTGTAPGEPLTLVSYFDDDAKGYLEDAARLVGEGIAREAAPRSRPSARGSRLD